MLVDFDLMARPDADRFAKLVSNSPMSSKQESHLILDKTHADSD